MAIDIPFFDINRQTMALMPRLKEAIAEVLENGQFVLGDKVTELEEKVSRYIGTEHAVALASGTDGLILSLMALGVNNGDAVITTPFSFFSTASSIVRCGARPVFIDIDPRSFNINVDKIEEFLEKECRRDDDGKVILAADGSVLKGIIPVHLFGQMAQTERLSELARREGLFMLEDGAQAFGAWETGEDGEEKRMACSMGEAGIFSFYPTKNLGAAGDAGLMVTSDQGINERIRMLRVHGSKQRDIFDSVGYCSRMDGIQAAVLLVKLPHIGEWNERRRELARNYIEAIDSAPWAGEVELPREEKGKRHIYHQFTLRSERRDEVIEHMGKNGIGCAIYYSRPLHVQPALAGLGYAEGDMPECEKAAREVFALPIWPELTDEEQGRVVKTLNLFYNKE